MIVNAAHTFSMLTAHILTHHHGCTISCADVAGHQPLKITFPEVGTPDTYVLLPSTPNIEDTIQLFTLEEDQELAFKQLATTLDDMVQGRPVRQIRMLTTGKPGTGKSQIIKAFLWYAFQHGQSHRIGITSFMWRAALHLSTSANPGLSTSRALGVNAMKGDTISPGQNVRERVQAYLSKKWFLFIDEFSFMSLRHLGRLQEATEHFLQGCNRRPEDQHKIIPEDPNAIFGSHLHVALFGDPYQHECPTGYPLYTCITEAMATSAEQMAVTAAKAQKAAEQAAKRTRAEQQGDAGTARTQAAASAKHAAREQQQQADLLRQSCKGRDVYLSLDSVYFLQKQHRMGDKKLQEYADMFMQPDEKSRPTRTQVRAMLEDLNARAVTDIRDLAGRGPRVVVQRNEVRLALEDALVHLHAERLGQRLIVWRSSDMLVSKDDQGKEHNNEVPGCLQPALQQLPASKSGHMPPRGYFFPGARYEFVDNDCPEIGRLNHNLCTAQALILHPDETRLNPEPEDPREVWHLKFPPMGVYVKPDMMGVQQQAAAAAAAPAPAAANTTGRRAAHHDPPPGCILISLSTKTFVYKMKKKKTRAAEHTSYTIKREGILLNTAYVVTDYFVQVSGWMAHGSLFQMTCMHILTVHACPHHCNHAQGMSFKDDCWIGHFNPPPDGKFQRASIFVMLSRWPSLDKLILLAPLWKPGDEAEKTRVVNQ